MNKPSFTTTKRDDLRPKCPHCRKELDEVFYQGKGTGLIEGRDVVFFCSHCSNVLGFGQSRMI